MDLSEGWRRQSGFRTQMFLGAVAVIAVAGLCASAIWCAVVALVIALVLEAELLNSPLETLVDRLHPATHSEMRVEEVMADVALPIQNYCRA